MNSMKEYDLMKVLFDGMQIEKILGTQVIAYLKEVGFVVPVGSVE